MKPVAILSVTHGEGLGAETVLCELLRGLQKSKSRFRIIAPPGSRVHRVSGELGFTVLDWPTKRDGVFQNFRAVGGLVPQFKECRLAHAWTARGFDAAISAAKAAGIPCTATLHDHPKADFHGRLRRLIMRNSTAGMVGLACVSKATAEAAQAAGYKCPLHVMPNGLNDFRRGTVSFETPPRIAFLGMYATWKGFAVVREWMESGKADPAHWNLYGELAKDVAPLLNGLDESRFTLHGRQPIAEILRDNDILVHASSHFDPLPTVLLEAACFGRPVVACNLGGATEIVDGGGSGFLFGPEDPGAGLEALAELVAHPGRQKKMGARGRKIYEKKFTIQKMVSRYQQLWRGSP